MKKIKKLAASLMAVATMATSMIGINASAAVMTTTVNKPFYVDGYAVTASLNIGSGSPITYYGASTSCSSSAITGRYVSLCGYCSNGNTVSDSSYSETGTVSVQIYASGSSYFTGGYSCHSAKHGSNTGSTTFSF